MEKLYEVDVCKIKLINEECGLSQYVKEAVSEKVICIKDDVFYINIDTNEEYLYLKNEFNHVFTFNSDLVPFIKNQSFATNVNLYEEDLSKRDVAINYLKATRTRRTLEERKKFIGKQKVKIG